MGKLERQRCDPNIRDIKIKQVQKSNILGRIKTDEYKG